MSFDTHIAAALYQEEPPLDFDAIVEEFEQSLRSAGPGRCAVTFDHDDLVLIDVGDLRIGLAWIAPEHPGQPHGLLVATGAAPDRDASDPTSDARLGDLCARLSEVVLARLHRRMPYDAIIRAALPDMLDDDLLDRVAADLGALDRPATLRATMNAVLDDIATPMHIVPPTPAPTSAPTAGVAAAASSATPVERLRAAYDAIPRPGLRSGDLLHAALTGASDALGVLVYGARKLWPAASSGDTDPYARLRPLPSRTQANPRFQRFDPDEYELYGSLLD